MNTVVAIVADTHSGSTTGLLTPGRWVGLDGQTHQLSKGQKVLWGQWEECWYRVRDLRKKLKARLVVVHNGDAIDGVHHGTTQLITNDKEEQKRMHIASMEKGLDIAKFNRDDILYYVHGTEQHVSTTEDAIARDFTWTDGKHYVPAVINPEDDTKFKDGRFIRYQLKLDINGVILDIAHHGFTAGIRAWTKGNMLIYACRSIYYEHIDRNLKPPRYVIRSHKHEYAYGYHRGRQGMIEGFITPAFQLKTHYGYKVACDKLSDIGMLIIVVEDNGNTYWECPMISYDEVDVEKI